MEVALVTVHGADGGLGCDHTVESCRYFDHLHRHGLESPIVRSMKSTLIESTLISINARATMKAVTTYVRSAEAARILGVSPVDALRVRQSRPDLTGPCRRRPDVAVRRRRARRGPSASRRNDQTPRPTIDVQIASSITKLADDGVELRGYPLTSLLQRSTRSRTSPSCCSSGELPTEPVTWPAADPDDRTAVTSTLRSRASRADRPAHRSPRRCSAGSTPTTTRRTAARRLLASLPAS